MYLSKEAQALANAIVSEEIEVSQSEKDALYRKIMQKKNTVVAMPKMHPRKRRIKPAYLIAASVAIVCLIGAGYASSAYFDKLYRRGDNISAEYDVVTDQPELLVETPAIAAGTPLVELEKTGRLYLGPVFQGKSLGELFDIEIRTPVRNASAQGLAGNGLGLLSMVSEDGMASTERVVTQPRSTQSVIDGMIENGKFMVTVNHPSFHAIGYWGNPFYQSLHYADDTGTLIGLTFDPHFSDAGIMPQTVYDGAKPEDVTLNGNHFVLMQMGDSYLADLYLGDHGSSITNKISISFGSAAKDRSKVMEILNTIQLHNAGANQLVVADKAFFANLPLPGVQENAEQIANAIRTVSGDESRRVWEQGTLALSSSQGGWRFAITAKEGFDRAAPFYPYSGQHTAIVEQSWFKKEKFSALTVEYQGDACISATHFSDDKNYMLVSAIIDDGYVRSPLDAIIAQAGGDAQYLKVEKLVNPTSDTPIAIMSNGKDNITVFSAKKIESGEFFVEKLMMKKSDLPADLS